jgi:hypothetical protein
MNERLQRLIDSIKHMSDDADLLPLPAKTDLLLYAPCPIKLVMKDRLDQIIESYKACVSLTISWALMPRKRSGPCCGWPM